MTAKTPPVKSSAKRASTKQAAESYAAKRRLLKEKLKTLHENSEALLASTRELLNRLPL